MAKACNVTITQQRPSELSLLFKVILNKTSVWLCTYIDNAEIETVY